MKSEKILVAIFRDLSTPLGGVLQKHYRLLRRGRHLPHRAETAVHEFLSYHLVEKLQQPVIIPVHVQDNDGMPIQAQLRPREYLGQLLERSLPTR